MTALLSAISSALIVAALVCRFSKAIESLRFICFATGDYILAMEEDEEGNEQWHHAIYLGGEHEAVIDFAGGCIGRSDFQTLRALSGVQPVKVKLEPAGNAVTGAARVGRAEWLMARQAELVAHEDWITLFEDLGTWCASGSGFGEAMIEMLSRAVHLHARRLRAVSRTRERSLSKAERMAMERAMLMQGEECKKTIRPGTRNDDMMDKIARKVWGAVRVQ